jgi:membrane protease YdiL (CAAX protease family)
MARLGRVDFTPPWTIGSAALAVVFAFAVIIIGTTAAYVWLGDSSTTPVVGWIFGCLLMALMIWQTRSGERDALYMNSSQTPLPLIMLIGLGAAIAIDIIGLALTRAFLPAPELLDLNLGALSAGEILVAALFMVVAQPLGEELVFRGVALPAFRSTLGAWGGLIVSAVAYGVFHWVAYTRYASLAAQRGQQSPLMWHSACSQSSSYSF